MRFKWFFVSSLTACLFVPVAPASSQVVPAARSGQMTFPFTVGAGPAGYEVDWSSGRMYGIGAWVDWRPSFQYINGLGLELEGRDIAWDQRVRQNFNQRTIVLGPSYAWYHFQRFHPYVKFLVGYGRTDFHLRSTFPYTHFDGLVRAPGGGLEFRLLNRLWLRADYEYQIWPVLISGTPDPQGFTVGASWSFAHIAHLH